MIDSEIRWGTGYDNVLSFEHRKGLDDIRTYRRPAPGSRRTRNAAGTTDAWVNKRDFVLAGRARWFNLPNWGGLGLQDFLDWAGEGNTFRFIPDRTYPNFYVDNCVLDDPFDDPQPSLEGSDGSQSIDIVMRQQAFDFTLAMRGLMFEYVPGKSLTDPSAMLATFTRASTARRVARDLSLASDAVDTLRDRHFEGSSRSTLLEISRTNALTFSEDLSNAVYTKNEVTITTDAITAADGTTTADLIAETIATDSHGVIRSMPGTTDNTNQALSVFVKAQVRTWAKIQVVTKANTAKTGYVNLSTGALGTVDGGLTIRVTTSQNGWYRLEVIYDVGTGATTPQMVVGPTTGDGIASYQGSLNQGIYAWGFQWEIDQSAASSYIPTPAGSTVTRSSDNLVFPFLYLPQAMTIYAKFVERGTSYLNDARIMMIGSAADGTPAVYLRAVASTGYRIAHRGSAASVSSTQAVAPTVGQVVELRGVLNSDGSVQLGQSIAGAAETIAALSAAGVLYTTAWSDTKLFINSVGVANFGLIALQSLKVAAGVKTLAEMRAA